MGQFGARNRLDGYILAITSVGAVIDYLSNKFRTVLVFCDLAFIELVGST